jgi:DNA recombination protein RmuC
LIDTRAFERIGNAPSRLGRDLYKRIADLSGHWIKLGKSLDRSVQTYNEAVGSLESRVLPAARKFADLDAGVHGVEIEQVAPIEKTTRALAAGSSE